AWVLPGAGRRMRSGVVSGWQGSNPAKQSRPGVSFTGSLRRPSGLPQQCFTKLLDQRFVVRFRRVDAQRNPPLGNLSTAVIAGDHDAGVGDRLVVGDIGGRSRHIFPDAYVPVLQADADPAARRPNRPAFVDHLRPTPGSAILSPIVVSGLWEVTHGLFR